MDKLNINNSKKLIIGLSVIFCTIILIVGVSFAYFSQSDTKETGNVITTEQVTLHYDDNDNYMFGNLIPVNENDVLKFASKDTDICKYQEGMYACNLYEFIITNNSNVTQELMITLKPTFNEFGNLYYILLDKNKDDISLDNVPVSNGNIVETNSIEIASKVVLGAGSSKTYTLVYYVKNLEDIDQTEQDAGKQFYAKVRVDSITTGTYAETSMESRCYEYEEITEGEYAGTYRLVSFNGIDEFGVADNTCGVTRNGDFYSINVPSKIKDEEGNELEISTLGNALFNGINVQTGQPKPTFNSFIENVVIEDGIKKIEDGDSFSVTGTFVFIGVKFPNSGEEANFDSKNGLSELNFDFNIKLPNTLKYIGTAAFNFNNIKEVNIPSSVETIADKAFGGDTSARKLSKVTFELDDNNNSSLKTIGNYSFARCDIKSIEIPYSVTSIGDHAFGFNDNLSILTFKGSLTERIEEGDNKNLLAIGPYAFGDAILNYQGTTHDDYLKIPARVESIGDSAFRYVNFIRYMGSREKLDTFGTNWYPSGATVKAYGEE